MIKYQDQDIPSISDEYGEARRDFCDTGEEVRTLLPRDNPEGAGGVTQARQGADRDLQGEKMKRMSLYKRGINDCVIARTEGVTPQSIWSWRKVRGLPPNAKPGNDTTLNISLNPRRDLGYFCGLVIGDGYISHHKLTRNYIICLGTTKKEMARTFLESAKKLGMNPYQYNRIKTRRFPNGTVKTDQMFEVVANSKVIYTALKPYKQKDYHWGIPDFLTTRESQWGFVEGLFDAEGSIHFDSRYKNKIHSFCIVSKHENNLIALKELLSNFGVHSKIYKHRHCFMLQIHKRESLNLFVSRTILSFKCKSLKELEGIF